MTFKHAAAFAAVLAVVAPVVMPAFATGSRLDREELAERRKAKPTAETPVWHYAAGTSQVGPLTKAELVAAVEAGTVKADTQVFHPDTGWRPASQVSELADALK